jgi:myo-inositol-1(or 4)-monophosphatase
LVACGRLTGYFEETDFTDTAAVLLAVQERGGVVTDWWGRGSTVYERTGVLLVANRATHACLRERLKDVPVKGPDEGS